MKLLITITVLTLTLATAAGTAFAGGSESGELRRIGYSAGVAYLWKVGGSWDASLAETGCTNTAAIAFDASTPNGQQLYRLMTSAYLANERIKVWTSGCYAGFPQVNRIDLGDV